MQVTKVNCPTNKYNIKCPYVMTPECITVHNTANDASAMSEVSYMLGNNKQVSFHTAIDEYRAVQGIDFNRNTWNAGDGAKGKGNRKSISIEICYSKSGGEKFVQAEKNAAEYIAGLLKKYNWGIEKVKKHQDWSKKYCPHRTLDKGWDKFLKMIESHLDKEEEKNNTNSYTVKITTAVLNVRKGPGTEYKVATTVKKNELYTIVETKGNWGKLKSGAGWISLKYTSKTSSTSTTKTTTSKYYPKCTSNHTSIVSALNSIKVNSSFSNRAKIAKKNNIKFYIGTASQNTKMLDLLKKGKLIKV